MPGLNDYICISYVQLNKFPKDFSIIKLFCVCSRSYMVMAALVVRKKRQVNAPRTVRKLALVLNRLHLFSHPPPPPPPVLLEILGVSIHVPPGPPNPDPFSDQKIHFPHPFSDLASMKLSVALWLYEGVNPWSRTLMISGFSTQFNVIPSPLLMITWCFWCRWSPRASKSDYNTQPVTSHLPFSS